MNKGKTPEEVKELSHLELSQLAIRKREEECDAIVAARNAKLPAHMEMYWYWGWRGPRFVLRRKPKDQQSG